MTLEHAIIYNFVNKKHLLYNIIVFMVMIIINSMPKIALHVIVGVLLGVTVENNLLDLFVLGGYNAINLTYVAHNFCSQCDL